MYVLCVYMYIYIYVYVCMCMYVCMSVGMNKINRDKASDIFKIKPTIIELFENRSVGLSCLSVCLSVMSVCLYVCMCVCVYLQSGSDLNDILK